LEQEIALSDNYKKKLVETAIEKCKILVNYQNDS